MREYKSGEKNSWEGGGGDGFFSLQLTQNFWQLLSKSWKMCTQKLIKNGGGQSAVLSALSENMS